MQTRSQNMAEKIYSQIKEVYGMPFEKSYGRICMRFPALILANGLLAATAFVRQKTTGKDEKRFLDDLKSVIVPAAGLPLEEYLMSRERCDLSAYMDATRRALEASLWYRRFAESVLGVEITDED